MYYIIYMYIYLFIYIYIYSTVYNKFVLGFFSFIVLFLWQGSRSSVSSKMKPFTTIRDRSSTLQEY